MKFLELINKDTIADWRADVADALSNTADEITTSIMVQLLAEVGYDVDIVNNIPGFVIPDDSDESKDN